MSSTMNLTQPRCLSDVHRFVWVCVDRNEWHEYDMCYAPMLHICAVSINRHATHSLPCTHAMCQSTSFRHTKRACCHSIGLGVERLFLHIFFTFFSDAWLLWVPGLDVRYWTGRKTTSRLHSPNTKRERFTIESISYLVNLYIRCSNTSNADHLIDRFVFLCAIWCWPIGRRFDGKCMWTFGTCEQMKQFYYLLRTFSMLCEVWTAYFCL